MISKIPDNINNLKTLKKLILSRNEIKSIENLDLPKLRLLDLSHNSINKIHFDNDLKIKVIILFKTQVQLEALVKRQSDNL